MLPQRPRSTALLLAATACGPSVPGEPMLGDVFEHEVLAERCGSPEPIELLSLAPNEALAPELHYGDAESPVSFLQLAPSGNGWVLGIDVFDREITPTTAYPTDDEQAPQRVSSRIVWVDGCGGDMKVLVEGTSSFRAPSGDEPWIACSGPNLLAFDPEGEHAGQWHPDLQCPEGTVGDAFLAKTWDDPEILVRARLPIDGPAEIMPLTDVHSVLPMHRVADTDRYVVLTDGYDLVELDARAGQVTVLRPDAYRFSASDDGRFVLWTRPVSPEPPPLLWDRQTDEERPLAPTEWGGEPVITGIDGNTAWAQNLDRDVTQLTLLQSGRELLLDGQWRGAGVLGETYVLEQSSSDGTSSLALLDPGSEVPRMIPHGTLKRWWVHDDRLWILVIVDDVDPSRMDLLELAPPDFSLQVVATDIGYPMRLADGRLLTVLDRNSGTRYGTLVLVDAEGLRREIDHDVLTTTATVAPLVDDVIVYAVRDPDDERTGVWAAQIAPIPEL